MAPLLAWLRSNRLWLVPSLAVNVPLGVVLFVFGGNKNVGSLLMHYPAQFAFLLLVFPFGAFLHNKATGRLREVVRTCDVTWIKPVDPARARFFAYGLCLLLSLVIVGFSALGDAVGLYSIDPESSETIVDDLDNVLERIAGLPSATDDDLEERADTISYVRYRVAQERGIERSVVKPRNDFAKKTGDHAARAYKEFERAKKAGLRTDVAVAEGIELAAAGFVGFHLFLVCAVLAALRFSKMPSQGDIKGLRMTAVYAGLSLALLSLWIPLRKFTISEMKLFDPDARDLGGPSVIFCVLVVTATFVYLVFTRRGKALEYVKGALPLLPVLASAFAVFSDPLQWQAVVGARANPASLGFAFVIGLVVFTAIFFVLRLSVEGAPASHADDS